MISVQAPTGATQERTRKAMAQAREYILEEERESVASLMDVVGFSLDGGGQNTGFGFVQLKDWKERRSQRLGVAALQGRLEQSFSQIKDAMVFAFAPPPVLELGDYRGFDFYLMDNLGQGHEALTAARARFLELAERDSLLANVRAAGQGDAPEFRLDIDAQKAASFGLSMSDINDTLSIAWGGRYIGDFIDHDQVKRVIMQADAPFRMVPADFSRWFVRNNQGQMVSAASFANSHWEYGPLRLERYNGFHAMEINGEAAPGVSSGAALREVEALVARLPPGYSAEFTGQSYEERAAAGQTPLLYSMSVLVVFLWLAVLYESWFIPLAIVLAVPLGIMGAVVATTLRGLENNIYFQVSMLTTMGLTCKNAILIV
jgi:multidrug efflux pump